MSIDPSSQTVQAPIAVATNYPTSTVPIMPGKTASNTSPFGPDYIVDENLKSQVPQGAAGTVPFVQASAGQTLAALPPLQPMGAAALTELALSQMLQSPSENPYSSGSGQ